MTSDYSGVWDPLYMGVPFSFFQILCDACYLIYLRSFGIECGTQGLGSTIALSYTLDY